MLTIEPAGAVLADTMTISSIKFGRLKLAVAGSLDGWCAADRTGIARGRRRRRCPGEARSRANAAQRAGQEPHSGHRHLRPGRKVGQASPRWKRLCLRAFGCRPIRAFGDWIVKVYKAGESFFEPPGSEHLVSENASATEPASLLAIFVADDGAQLTTFDK